MYWNLNLQNITFLASKYCCPVLKAGGTICGRYKLQREIRRGGMSVVYEAVDRQGNTVAVKVPNLEVSDCDVAVNKLRVEREVLKRIWERGGHRYIVKYVDECDVEGVPVLVVEYIKGSTLSSYEGMLDIVTAYNLAVKLAEILEFLHGMNMIHRDFCPDNIMLRNDDPNEPVLIDLGTVDIGGQRSRIEKEDCTPPEQAVLGTSTKASDIYMWGATFMRMVKRRTKWKRLRDIQEQGLGTRLKPSDFIECGEYADLVDKVLSRALDPDPEKRYQSAEELLNDLMGVAVRRYYLVVEGVRIPLTQGEYIIGTEGDIRVPDPEGYVSHRHARIRYDGNRGIWVLEDLCSTNGTVVIREGDTIVVYKGHRGREKCRARHEIELKPGDVIGLAYKMSDPGVIHKKVKFEVEESAAVETKARVASRPPPQGAPLELDLEDVLREVVKHGVVAFIGYMLGRMRPEVKKFEKPVLIDPSLPYHRENGITYIIADRSEVVVEDSGHHLYVRRAKPAEAVSQITRRAAERLLDDFRQRIYAIFKGAHLRELSRQPSFLIEIRNRRVLGKIQAVAVGYCRPGRLAAMEVDHEPADIGQVVREFRLEKYLQGGIPLILASPTGWTSQPEHALRSRKIVLINLKTGEANHGGDPKAEDIVKRLGYGEAETPLSASEKCDEMLVEGQIDYRTYLLLAREGKC